MGDRIALSLAGAEGGGAAATAREEDTVATALPADGGAPDAGTLGALPALDAGALTASAPTESSRDSDAMRSGCAAISAYVPTARTTPPTPSTTTRSHLGSTHSALVTSTRVVPVRKPAMQRSNRCAPTWASTAASGSSSSTATTELAAYVARAKHTRAFWPPLKVTPFSPISVKSPSTSIAMSGFSAHASMTLA